jgi:SH3 domain protein
MRPPSAFHSCPLEIREMTFPREMKRILIFWIFVLPLCLFHPLCWAATVYVTDSFEVTLRTGPSVENRIIEMLSSGQPLEVLETQEDWSRVRLVDSGEDQKEGWVLSRYLIDRQPWEAQAKALVQETISLREELATIKKRSEQSSQRAGELQRRLQQTSEALSHLQEDFESLRKESSEFLKVKEQYEAAQSALREAQDTVHTLTRENETLRYSRTTTWFLAGALVFFSALLIGLIIGRREKKRRTGLSQWKRQ